MLISVRLRLSASAKVPARSRVLHSTATPTLKCASAGGAVMTREAPGRTGGARPHPAAQTVPVRADVTDDQSVRAALQDPRDRLWKGGHATPAPRRRGVC